MREPLTQQFWASELRVREREPKLENISLDQEIAEKPKMHQKTLAEEDRFERAQAEVVSETGQL